MFAHTGSAATEGTTPGAWAPSMNTGTPGSMLIKPAPTRPPGWCFIGTVQELLVDTIVLDQAREGEGFDASSVA